MNFIVYGQNHLKIKYAKLTKVDTDVTEKGYVLQMKCNIGKQICDKVSFQKKKKKNARNCTNILLVGMLSNLNKEP